MDEATNMISHYFPEDHELIVRHSTSDCDLNEMREHFEELALLLQRNVGSEPPNRMTDNAILASTLESLRLEICEHLTKLK
jgi:hypothetical protein